MSSIRMVERNFLVYRRYWRATLMFSFVTPMLFLGAVGFGIGTLVTRQDSDAFGGVSYLAFFATGLLVSSCMNTASFDSAWPILGKFMWQRNYEAMLSTPLQVPHLFFGELAWLTLRLSLVAVPLFIVIALFGVITRPEAIFAIPVAILTGLGFGAAVMTYSATIEQDNSFNGLFRFIITPLFLFSGTFFPLDALPSWIGVVANFTPLYHGIELSRGLTIQHLSLAQGVWHLAYLVVFLAVGCFVGLRNYEKRLKK